MLIIKCTHKKENNKLAYCMKGTKCGNMSSYDSKVQEVDLHAVSQEIECLQIPHNSRKSQWEKTSSGYKEEIYPTFNISN